VWITCFVSVFLQIHFELNTARPDIYTYTSTKPDRNDNSSRFGKFVEIHFNVNDNETATPSTSPAPGKIVGCTTVTYLLEKSRVVSRFAGERNFHIFHYMLLEDFPSDLRSSLQLDNRTPEDFTYLSSNGAECAGADQHDDQQEFNKLHSAMQEMGMVESDLANVFKAAAAVLHLGNVSFMASGDTGSSVALDDPRSAAAMAAFAQLTGVDEAELSQALTMHVSVQRDGTLTRPFSPQQASSARHALARHVYGRLFAWLVQRVNDAMAMAPPNMTDNSDYTDRESASPLQGMNICMSSYVCLSIDRD
jgi:myosin heavy subunit